MRLAKEIRVDRDERGAPQITIDGETLPWFTAGIVTPAPSLDEVPTVTITIPAEKVVVENRATPSASYLRRVSGAAYRCGHPACLGVHITDNEQCC
jgi:hypothetical protein